MCHNGEKTTVLNWPVATPINDRVQNLPPLNSQKFWSLLIFGGGKVWTLVVSKGGPFKTLLFFSILAHRKIRGEGARIAIHLVYGKLHMVTIGCLPSCNYFFQEPPVATCSACLQAVRVQHWSLRWICISSWPPPYGVFCLNRPSLFGSCNYRVSFFNWSPSTKTPITADT